MTNPNHDPNDPERDSNIWRNEDGSPIENSTPEEIEEERIRHEKLERANDRN